MPQKTQAKSNLIWISMLVLLALIPGVCRKVGWVRGGGDGGFRVLEICRSDVTFVFIKKALVIIYHAPDI